MTTGAFSGLRCHSVMALLEVVRANEGSRSSVIRRRFGEVADGYEEATAFATRLSLVKKEAEGLVLTAKAKNIAATKNKRQLLDAILSSRNRYRTAVFYFLGKFKVQNGTACHAPAESERSKESYVRNFLIELGAVRHNPTAFRYELLSDDVFLLETAMDNANFTAPSVLQAQLLAADQLGAEAELAVLNHERQRVGPLYAEKVDHVAARNAGAGYDIRSLTVRDPGSQVPRFIEVKAVSRPSMRFYWTRNEMATASALGEWYYLYLVPVDRGQFDFDHLMVIANPSKELMENDSRWVLQPESVVCCLADYNVETPS